MKPARHAALATLACSLVLSLALPLHVAHADDDDPVAPPAVRPVPRLRRFPRTARG